MKAPLGGDHPVYWELELTAMREVGPTISSSGKLTYCAMWLIRPLPCHVSACTLYACTMGQHSMMTDHFYTLNILCILFIFIPFSFFTPLLLGSMWLHILVLLSFINECSCSFLPNLLSDVFSHFKQSQQMLPTSFCSYHKIFLIFWAK